MFNPLKVFKRKNPTHYQIKQNQDKSILETILIHGGTRLNVFNDVTVVESEGNKSVYYSNGSSINIMIR